MFSQVCAKNSVHRGRFTPTSGLTPPADIPLNPGRHPRAEIPLDRHPLGRHHAGRHTPYTATAVHGTYPTGMHYCFGIPQRVHPEKLRLRLRIPPQIEKNNTVNTLTDSILRKCKYLPSIYRLCILFISKRV